MAKQLKTALKTIKQSSRNKKNGEKRNITASSEKRETSPDRYISVNTVRKLEMS
jgi:hypothetical protein